MSLNSLKHLALYSLFKFGALPVYPEGTRLFLLHWREIHTHSLSPYSLHCLVLLSESHSLTSTHHFSLSLFLLLVSVLIASLSFPKFFCLGPDIEEEVGNGVIIHSLSIKCRGAATFFVDSLVFSSLTRETERYPLFFPFFSFALTTGLLPLCEKQELELVLGFFKENKILFQDS